MQLDDHFVMDEIIGPAWVLNPEIKALDEKFCIDGYLGIGDLNGGRKGNGFGHPMEG